MGQTRNPCWELDFMPPETPSQACSDTANTDHITSEDSLVAALSGASAHAVADASSDASVFAEAIKKAGMAGPASIALRIAGPLAWIGGQMLWAVQPLVQGLRVGPRRGQQTSTDMSAEGMVPRLARFLEGEGNVAELVAHLESSPEPGRERGKASKSPTGKDHGLF